MTEIVQKLSNQLENFDSQNSADRDLLMNMTMERFRRRLEEFNNNNNLGIYIDGYTTGIGNLTLNKNVYYLYQLIYKNCKMGGNNSIVKEFEDNLIKVEQSALESFRNTYLPEAINKIGGEREVNARIALTGSCHITLDNDIATGWINTHTIAMLGVFMWLLGVPTPNDFNSLIHDFFEPYISQFYSQKSVIV